MVKFMRKCKVFRKIIIIATLASILVSSLFSVAASAAGVSTYDDLLGQWYVKDNFNTIYSSLNVNNEFGVSCRVPYIETLDDTVIRYSDFTESAFIFENSADYIIGLSFSPLSVGSNAQFPRVSYFSDRIEISFSYSNYVVVTPDHSLYDQLHIIEFTSGRVESFNTQTPTYYYDNVQTYLEPYIPPEPRTVVDVILDIFLSVGNWISGAFTVVAGIFWSFELSKLTLLGCLAVIPLGFGVMLLFFNFVKGWCQF